MDPNWPHYRPPHPAQPPHTGHPGQPGLPSTQMAAYGSPSPPTPTPTRPSATVRLGLAYPYGMPPPHPMWPNPYAQQHMDPRARPGVMEFRNEREDATGVGARAGGRAAPRACLCTREVPGRAAHAACPEAARKPRQVQVWFRNSGSAPRTAKPTVAEALAHAAVANAQENRTRAEPERNY